MVKINNISLQNYRNFSSLELNFNKNCNILNGNNGAGKTNILESLSLIGKGRGFRNDKIHNLIKTKKDNFLIKSEVNFENNNYDIEIWSKKINETHRKNYSLNNHVSKDNEQFINSIISYLYFLPEMERLFLTSPSFRRNFFDKLIFSINKNYNKTINSYKKYLLERNTLLKKTKL